MRAMTVMLAAALLCGGSGCDRLRDDPPVVREAPRPALEAAVLGSVVRVDMGGRFRGAGIAVDPRHVVTALGILDEYEFHRRRATVGASRIPGRVTAVDAARGLALIRTERPLTRWASLSETADFAHGAPAVVVGYADVDSEPPMVEMRQVDASVDNAHFHGESTGELNLHDVMTVSSANASEVRRRGAAVFDPSTGRVAGMVIGSMMENPRANSPFIAVSAPTLRAFLAAHGVTTR